MQHWGTQWQILLCFQCRIQAEEIQSFNKTWSWTCKYSLQVWKDKAHSFLWPGCRTSMVKSLREFRKCSSQFHNPWIWMAWAIGSLWFRLLVYPGQRSSLEGKMNWQMSCMWAYKQGWVRFKKNLRWRFVTISNHFHWDFFWSENGEWLRITLLYV